MRLEKCLLQFMISNELDCSAGFNELIINVDFVSVHLPHQLVGTKTNDVLTFLISLQHPNHDVTSRFTTQQTSLMKFSRRLKIADATEDSIISSCDPMCKNEEVSRCRRRKHLTLMILFMLVVNVAY